MCISYAHDITSITEFLFDFFSKRNFLQHQMNEKSQQRCNHRSKTLRDQLCKMRRKKHKQKAKERTNETNDKTFAQQVLCALISALV